MLNWCCGTTLLDEQVSLNWIGSLSPIFNYNAKNYQKICIWVPRLPFRARPCRPSFRVSHSLCSHSLPTADKSMKYSEMTVQGNVPPRKDYWRTLVLLIAIPLQTPKFFLFLLFTYWRYAKVMITLLCLAVGIVHSSSFSTCPLPPAPYHLRGSETYPR